MARNLQEAIHLFQQGDLDEAKAAFGRFIQSDPKDAKAHLWLGNCHILEGDLKLARNSFRSAAEYGSSEIQKEAQTQLRSLFFNRFLKRLILEPPLRPLLLGAFAGYGVSVFTRFAGFSQASSAIQLLSLGVMLPLFFLWAFFIIVFFVANIAFDQRRQGSGANAVRLLIAAFGVLALPANLLMFHHPALLFAALAIDFVLLSLGLSRLINWIGQRLTGEIPLPFLFLPNFDEPAMQKAVIPVEKNPPREP